MRQDEGARRAGLRGRVFSAAVLLLSLVGPALAQLSPGLLSQPHSHLEGSANCLECHESRKGVDSEKCLGCHELLAARVRAGEGLHARPEYADCKSCHIDHHGLEFELVWWGEEGIDAFDHQLTGLRLEGAHRALGCRECHRGRLLRDREELAARGKDPNRTFLGLGRDCLSCHQDEHRGQLAEQGCLACHTQQSWTPISGFDHQETSYPLTGSHLTVGCEECHELVSAAAGEEGYRQFTGLPFARCSDCHQDPHLGRLGGECAECHVTAAWASVDDRSFDHDRTRYPLVGLHRQIACEACHLSGESFRGLEFGRCEDCHRDAHLGQLAQRRDGGACEGCHDVEGFSPARYEVPEHQSVFALEGAHLAVACNDCHKPIEPTELIRLGVATATATAPGERTPQLRFPSTTCLDCHQDPHARDGVETPTPTACVSCHVVETWRQVAFDHAATAFVLVGRHEALGCRECHTAGEGEGERLAFDGLDTPCSSCHPSPHQGQFADDSGEVACERCHIEERWIPASRFEHDRDAAFGLEGAHRDVPCVSCHASEPVEDGTFVRYLPVSRACSACHAEETLDQS